MKIYCPFCMSEHERNNDRPFVCTRCHKLVDPLDLPDNGQTPPPIPKCVTDSITKGDFYAEKNESFNHSGLAFKPVHGGVAVVSCSSDASHISIPESYNGMPVVSVAANAFQGKNGLVSVTLPDTLRTIGDRSFAECTSLRVVKAGSGLEYIGKDAFFGCIQLEDFSFDSVPLADVSAFSGCYRLGIQNEKIRYTN